jgi:hypothetical protein
MSGHDPGPLGPAWLTVLTVGLAAEVLAVTAFQAPFMTIVRFVWMDSGGELAMQDLMSRGFRPAVDFGYPYGLLPLLIGRAWYGLAGLSPWAFRVEVTACMLVSAWGMARFAAYRRVPAAGLALIALAIPDLLFVTNLTLVQVMEQALLIHALAEQARGRRGAALAWLTACCFVKPSLAYVQGLFVTLAAVAACLKCDRSAWARSFAPPLVTAALLTAILSAFFGPLALAKTLVPGTGMAIYRASNYGFFHGVGRQFWALPNAGLRDYFRYEVGFWLLGTAFLALGGLASLVRSLSSTTEGKSTHDGEVVVTCTAVHLVFVLFLFGHRITWVYSLPVLILGLALLARRGRWQMTFVWILAVFLLVNDRSKAVEVLRLRRTEAASPSTFGLWTTPGMRQEWERVRELTRGQRAVLFAMCEGGAVLEPGFAPPVGGYLIPGNMIPGEARRKAEQLARASVIVSSHPPDWEGFSLWPELAAALDGCEPVMEGQFVRVYRRVSPPRGISDAWLGRRDVREPARPSTAGQDKRGR